MELSSIVVAYDIHLADRVRSILERTCKFDEKRMFGGLAFMVNNHMCCGVLKTDLVLRLTPEEVAASLHKPHTRPMDFTGKPMKSMIYVSPIGTDSDQALTGWIESAVTVAQRVTGKEPVQKRPGRPRPGAKRLH